MESESQPDTQSSQQSPVHDSDEDHPDLGGSSVSIQDGMINLNIRTPSGEMPSSLEEGAAILERVGHIYFERYQARALSQDSRIAIACYIQASSLTPDSDPLKPSRVGNIGNAYLVRFYRLDDLEDLESAIEHHTQAVGLVTDDNSHKPGMLANLGSSYLQRFDRLDNVEDLDKGVEYHTAALSLMPDEHPFKSALMNNLGSSLLSRYERFQKLHDLNTALNLQTKSLELASHDHPNRPARLNNLGRSYLARFKSLGDLADLENAIKYQQESISCSPDNHPELPGRIHDLAKASLARYEILGNPEDLNLAIVMDSHAANLCPAGDSYMSILLGSLSSSFLMHYKRFGELANLDNGIQIGIRAVELTPIDHPDRPARVNNLGMCYCNRFQRLGDKDDIEKAIELHTAAVSLLPGGHPSRFAFLINLGAALEIRFESTEDPKDLNASLDYHNQALSMMPPGHTNEHTLLNNLGILYFAHLEISGDLYDANAAIRHQARAIKLLDESHNEKPGWLNNLGISYRALFERTKNMPDIHESIDILSQAVALTPTDHPLQSNFMRQLGLSYRARFAETSDPKDLDMAVEHFEKATKLISGPPSSKLKAAFDWARCSYFNRLSSTREAYGHLIQLLPQVAWIGNNVSNRYNRLQKLDGLASEAVTLAIFHGDYSTALEWMEEGRSIVWSQMLKLRTSLEQLSVVNETLAKAIREAAQNLETLSGNTIAQVGASEWRSNEQVAQRYRRAAERWDESVSQARSLPGMDQFLLPQTSSRLVQAAHSGAIVLLITQSGESHALVIPKGGSQVSYVALPRFSIEKGDFAQAQLARSLQRQGRGDRGFAAGFPLKDDKVEKILLMLWVDVVKPVLESLGYLQLPLQELPHITWCTSGALNFLPLHAAGDYSTSSSTLFDYAVSSYTPNLRALLAPNPGLSRANKILAVGQTSTPGFSDLPATAAELNEVQHSAAGVHFTKIDGFQATPPAVLEAMTQHSWVHFACHASQNLDRPLSSAFHLHEGPLTLEAITRVSIPRAELAFLSACQTAAGDHKIPDEAVHLAAGMLVTGYRTVIATMWSIDDSDAPVIAKEFYAYMLEGGYDPKREASRALHHAVSRLRAQVGVKEFGRWAPFIHMGL
ncbi:CHAT domain protein [Ceratobasidium sp. AG-Ba]|nr:CHAT domain protein [Ceratobasidium sp. AG-Ba]